MSGFDALWLAQREPFDLAARSSKIENRFIQSLQQQTKGVKGPLRILDLGGGTGANFRALAPRINSDQRWLLCDYDTSLLASALSSVAEWSTVEGYRHEATENSVVIFKGPTRWSLETRKINLAIDLESIDATDFDGVTTTAFLDLVSYDWLKRLAQWIHTASATFLATATVDGRRQWTPELEDDRLIYDAFRHHQISDKGFGNSIGPEATQSLEKLLCDRALFCETDKSDWNIRPVDSAMLGRMSVEAAGVALEVYPSKRSQIDSWLLTREKLIAQGLVSYTVGHLDLVCLNHK